MSSIINYLNRERLKRIAVYIAGCLLFGASFNMFILPGGIIIGGATGIAATVSYFNPDVPTGTIFLLVNLPIILAELKYGTKKYAVKGAVGVVGTSLATDLLAFLPAATPDTLLCALLGGGLMGVGSGLLLSVGYTTGGSDHAATLLSRHSKVKTGTFILIIDFAVITCSAALTSSWAGIIYALISSTAYSFSIDTASKGARRDMMMIAFSSKLPSGSIPPVYTTKYDDKYMIIYSLRRRDIYDLRQSILNCDEDAVILCSDASHIMNENGGLSP